MLCHTSRGARRLPGATLVLAAGFLGVSSAGSLRWAQAAPPTSALLRQVAARFIENRGQLSGAVRYYVQGADRSVYFTPDGVTLSLTRLDGDPVALPASPPARPLPEKAARYAVKLEFVDPAAGRSIEGEVRQPGTANFLRGRSRDWKRRVPTFAGLTYRQLWHGVDLCYRGTETGLKYEFRVQPGVDPAAIRLAYRGADRVSVTADGALQVETPGGTFTDPQPLAYQEQDGRRVPVTSRYEVARRPDGAWEYSFRLGRYDHHRPLVIDPALLLYCGYLGGSAQDLAAGVAVDAEGNAYVAGYTYSGEATFPAQAGFDPTANGDVDAFVAKIRADGTGLEYCTYLGGTGSDSAACIAVDPDGRVCVGGATDSTEATFPVTGGPHLTYHGQVDGWVARLKADGSGLDFCGYLGGNASDAIAGIATDADGHVFVAGNTFSNETTFPVIVGPDLTHNGILDAFVARLSASGSSLEYCGYLGGLDYENAYGAALAPNGELGVVGRTNSSEASFPVVTGPDLTFNSAPAESLDGFVARVKADGSGLVYSGFIGGSDNDTLYSIAFDPAGNAYVAGSTYSDETSFPVTQGPGLAHSGSGQDAFVAKVNAAGTALSYCGYLGGRGEDVAYGVAVDAGGNAYVGGATQATESSFPVKGGPDARFHGGFQDGFVARVRASGTGLDYCGYLGGAGTDLVSGIAVDLEGNAYVAGATGSGPDSFPARVGPLTTFSGGSASTQSDGFIAKVSAYSGPVGEAGRLTLGAKRLQAGGVKLGKSKTLKLKIKNRGPGSVHLHVPALGAPFTVSPTGNLLLPPRQTQLLTVTFAPTVKASVVTGLALTSDDPTAPLTVIPLSGKGK